MSAELLLEIRNLKTYFFTYRGVVKAVDDVSFTVGRGEAVGLVGESGCGKSTTAYSIIGLVPPPGRIVGGQILFDGMDLTKFSDSELRRRIRWKRIAMVFQGAMNAFNPVRTIGDQIVEAATYHLNITKAEALDKARQLLELVGLDPNLIHRYPHELSGGMKQRAFIAMALVCRPDLLIADEPTTALDVVVQAQIINLIKRLQQELKMSLILITHDVALTSEIVDRVVVMYAGKIAEQGPSDILFTKPQHPYTQGLISSIPRLHNPEKITWIPGFPPDLVNPPKGCRFHPRCPHTMPICREKEPPEIELGPNHYVYCWLHARR
ncbi:ABC transporter ATP-binding protein [archaeon]|nr:ABC transporter ATP-binding protein [archaeon]